MGRQGSRPAATHEQTLSPLREQCGACGQQLWVASHHHRTVVRLDGLWRLTLRVRQCGHAACPPEHRAVVPEEAGAWALPHGEFGLDVLAFMGHQRAREPRSVPQIHPLLRARDVPIAERSVTVVRHRYEEVVALRLADAAALRARLRPQGGVILALDGRQPEGGHEVLWVVRDVVSGAPLLARRLFGATADDLVPRLAEVHRVLLGARTAEGIPMRGVIADGQVALRHAVARALAGGPQQVCHFQDLREAAKPLFEADRHAKNARKKRVRGVRPRARSRAGQRGAQAEAVRGSGLAVRSARTDDGQPPLAASGRTRKGRREAIADSLDRVQHAREAQDTATRSTERASHGQGAGPGG